MDAFARVTSRVCAAAFFTLALLTMRQAFASSASSLEQRAALDPDHAGSWHRLALDADPRLSTAWIALGLEAERDRRLNEARRDLLEAARVDRQYLPAWTLAGFFFRQDNLLRQYDPAEFWTWARRAAALSYDDPRPLLQLAHAMEPDALAVLRNLNPSDRILRADLDYLVDAADWPAAQQVALALRDRHDPADRPRLLETADRQIRAGNAADAIELWNVFYPPLDPWHGLSLTNGALAQPPSNLGFDWRIPSAPGVETAWQPGTLSFTFDGSQCEECSLLDQVIPLAPGARRYALHFDARVSGLASPSGLRWDLGGQAGPPISPASDWRQFTAALSAPRGALAHLRLLYRREPGTARAPGLFQLRSLHLRASP